MAAKTRKARSRRGSPVPTLAPATEKDVREAKHVPVNVFISHSTRTVPEHRKFRRALTDRLKKEGFGVVVDEESLTAGAHWRDVIFGTLADCNAAVVLVNKPALCSDWVDTEARIACWRAWVERKEFRVIIVPFGGITRTQIAAHKPWQPLALAEVQMVAAETLDIDNKDEVANAFNEITAALRSMSDYATGCGGELWIVNILCSFLPKKVVELKRVAAKLEIVPIGPEANIRREVAKWMYKTGPTALLKFLDAVVRPIPARDREFLLELLSTHWIDPRASTSILRYCSQQATDQIFAINGAKHWFTPQAYVQQLRRSSIVWPVFKIDQKRPTEEILGDIRSELQKTYRKGLGKLINHPERASDSVLDIHLNYLLEKHARSDDFAFVALPPSAVNDASLISAIHGKWKWIRIVACTGTEAGQNPLPAIPMIEPELDIEIEEEVSGSYLAAVDYT